MRWDRALDPRLIALGSAAAAAIAFLRGRYLRWGATDEEANIAVAGDQLVHVVARAGANGART
jgi:hypothetical protein